MMDQERISRMRTAITGEKIDALILRLPENITMLGGYYPKTGRNFLLFPAVGDPVVLIPANEWESGGGGWWENISVFKTGVLGAADFYETIAGLLNKVASGSGRRWQRIGYEGSFETVAPALLSGESFVPAEPTRRMLASVFSQAEMVDCTNLLYAERGIKTGAEISKLAIAGKIAGIGLAEFAAAAVPGRTEAEIAGLITAAVMKKGAGLDGCQRIQAFPQVSSGPERTAIGWHSCLASTDRIIVEGDLVMLELALVAGGFWSDTTRTVVAGEPSGRQKEVMAAVKAGQQAAIKRAAAGVRVGDVDLAGRQVIEAAGMGKYFFQITGHGLGFSYHEPIPFLAPGNAGVLKTGMVFSVEPGVYVPGFGGVRFEDNVCLTTDGARVLTPA